MKHKIVSMIALVAFLNYIIAGCNVTREHKMLKDELVESDYSEKIVTAVLKDGTTYHFSPEAKFKIGYEMISGIDVNDRKVSVELENLQLKEIRTSKPETVPLESICGIEIYEIVFNDGKFENAEDGVWIFNRSENKLVLMQNGEIRSEYPADNIREVRVKAPNVISTNTLLNNPNTSVQEIIIGNKLHTFKYPGATLTSSQSVLYGITFGGKSVSIPYENILYVKVKRVDTGGAILATLGVMVLIVGIIGLIAMATKQSCPFVYSFDGENYVFDAEPLGGAVSKGLQKTDFSRLEHLRAVDGKYQLLFRNEVRETQYLDQIKLLIFDHDTQSTIIPDAQGNFYELSGPVAASGVYDESGQDLSSFFNKKDGVAWQTDLPRGETSAYMIERHHLTLTFPKPEGATHANLVFNGGTAAWGSNMIRKMLELRGDQLDQWYAGIDLHGQKSEELYRFIMREELYYMKINIKNDDQWVTGGVITGGGPLITEDRIIPIDLSEIKGDELTIRLDPPPGFWQIDYLAMDYDPQITDMSYQVPLQFAVNQSDVQSTDELISKDYVYYQMPEVGDWCKTEFIAPEIPVDLKRSIFLKTTGYYELHIDKTKPAEQALIKTLLETPGEIIRYSMKRYFEWYNQKIAAN
jgi:hypothetical protein